MRIDLLGLCEVSHITHLTPFLELTVLLLQLLLVGHPPGQLAVHGEFVLSLYLKYCH